MRLMITLATGLALFSPLGWAGTTTPATIQEDPAQAGYEPEVVFQSQDEVLVDSLLPLESVTGGSKNPLKTTPGVVLYKHSTAPYMGSLPPKITPNLSPPPPNFKFGSEKILYPLASLAILSSPFGLRAHPITGQSQFHRGIDLAAATGTPIFAAFSGQVLSAGTLGGLGNAVVLGHGTTTRTRYGHLSAIKVSVGQWVKQGELIGSVGATGMVTGPHLHFELWQAQTEGWQALDPGELLLRALPALKAPPSLANLRPINLLKLPKVKAPPVPQLPTGVKALLKRVASVTKR